MICFREQRIFSPILIFCLVILTQFLVMEGYAQIVEPTPPDECPHSIQDDGTCNGNYDYLDPDVGKPVRSPPALSQVCRALPWDRCGAPGGGVAPLRCPVECSSSQSSALGVVRELPPSPTLLPTLAPKLTRLLKVCPSPRGWPEGSEENVILSYGAFHPHYGCYPGIAIAVGIGNPIRTTLTGTVTAIRTGYNHGYGNTVEVTCGMYRVVFSHLDMIKVTLGQKVEANETIIGTEGATGYAIKPHLLYRMWVGMLLTDPGLFIHFDKCVDWEEKGFCPNNLCIPVNLDFKAVLQKTKRNLGYL